MSTVNAPWTCGRDSAGEWQIHQRAGEPIAVVRSEASARLIAAAPELLAALKAIVAVLQKEAPGTALNHHQYDGIGIQAHAAIAKAEGTTP